MYTWLITDLRGEAQGAAGHGVNRVRVSTSDWQETREVDVKGSEQPTIEFHRAWDGERLVHVTTTLDGAAFVPSAGARAVAWATDFAQSVKQSTLDAQWRFDVAFDAPRITVLVLDGSKGLFGFGEAKEEDDSLTLAMRPAAQYRGLAVDGAGAALPGIALAAMVKNTYTAVCESVTTDEAGRFAFAALPADLPLWLSSPKDSRGRHRESFLEGKAFEAGEVRTGETLVIRWEGDDASPAASVAAAPKPLKERVATAASNARLAGMQALVVVEGDGSSDTHALALDIVNYDKHQDVLWYSVVAVNSGEAQSEAKYFAERGWTAPAAGHVACYVVTGAGEAAGQGAFAAEDREGAAQLANEYLRKWRPAARDAREKLAAAQEEAKKSGRRVWVVQGGPRCGPCFRLARWMDEHHDELARDYVVVKLMDALDLNVEETMTLMGPTRTGGIPWYAITDAEGTVLTTSTAPLGNIGFPTTVEDFNHLRGMLEKSAQRMSKAEIEALVGSFEN